MKFRSGSAEPTQAGRLARLVGAIEVGPIEPGMNLHIVLNDSLTLTVPVDRVLADGGESALLLACKDEAAPGDLIALNLTDELFQVEYGDA